jgi:excisionase family DNA binding protein
MVESECAAGAQDIDASFAVETCLWDGGNVAAYLVVGPVTLYRWHRKGSLPCLTIGESWHIRRAALEGSDTFVGRLRSFLEEAGFSLRRRISGLLGSKRRNSR